MGAKRKDPKPKKITKEKLSEVASALAAEDEDTVSLVRKIASAFDMEKTVDVLDASEEIIAAFGALLRRGDERYTLAEAAEKAGLPVEQLAQLNLALGFTNPHLRNACSQTRTSASCGSSWVRSRSSAMTWLCRTPV